jgi:hypothetical protein
MGKTVDIADNLVKSAKSLKYDDYSAKDKVIQFAEKLIRDEFGETSVYLQKLRLIVFSPKDSAVLGGMGAGEDNIKRAVFESGVEKLIELLEEVYDKLGGKVEARVLIVHSRDIATSKRISAYVKSKGYDADVVKDDEDWRSKIDEILS